MRIIWLAMLGVCMATQAVAQSVPAPKLAVNDSWSYRHTVQNRAGWHQQEFVLNIVRVRASEVAVAVQLIGSPMPPAERLNGSDWTVSRSVNGHETVVGRPLSFPLTVGKTWSVEYTVDHPNRQHTSEHLQTTYKVTGWEDVTVPGGTFHALKIEGDGTWSAAIAPAVSGTAGTRLDAQGTTTVMQTTRTTPKVVSGRIYKALWYVPKVKRWVKYVEEGYDANDVRTVLYTDELTASKVSD